MSKKVSELLDLLRESDANPALAVASSEPAKQPGAEANRVVSGKELDGLLDDEVEELEEPMGDFLLPEADLLAASGTPLPDPSPIPDQPKAGEGKGNLSADALVSSDDLENDIDPEVAEIIRMMEEGEELEDSDDEENEDDKSEDGESENNDFAATHNVGLSDEEVKDVVTRANEGEEQEEGKQNEPLPGSETLPPEQIVVLKRLFDESVKEVAEARISKAVRLAEQVLSKKYEQIILTREEKLNEQISHYLEYVVETWRKQNEPKLFTTAQVKVAKKIFESVKTLVETFDIETVDISSQLIDMYEDKIATLTSESNKLVSENADLLKEVSLRDRALIIEEASKGLPLTEIENFRAVVAKIKAEDLDTFKENVTAMKKSFMPKAVNKVESIQETNETLALRGGIRKEVPSVKTEADLIANLIPAGIESNK
jgi:hypothetical protein